MSVPRSPRPQSAGEAGGVGNRAGARYALYYAPPATSPWWHLGCRWLGRDAATDEPLPAPRLPGLTPERWRALTAAPRHYGFHATLKAPFALANGHEEASLMAAVAAFVAERKPFVLPPPTVRSLAGFLALRPSAPQVAMDAMAAEAVRAFEPFRAPLAADELRRRAGGLAPRERALLARWGYPYVFEAYRFHLTLTDALQPDEREAAAGLLGTYLAPVNGEPLPVEDVCVFGQSRREHPFRLLARARFGGGMEVLGTLA